MAGWVNTLSSREYIVSWWERARWFVPPLSHMNDPEQRLLVNLENSCNVKSAEATVALSTLPAALEEAATWPAHYQHYYSRKPIVTALWSGVLESGLQGSSGSHNRTTFVTEAEWMHGLRLKWCWEASLVLLKPSTYAAWMAYLDGIFTRQRHPVSSFPFFSNNGAESWLARHASLHVTDTWLCD